MQTDGVVYPRAQATVPPREAELASHHEDAEALAERFQALADASRLKVLHLLYSRGEMCACELQSVLGVSASNLSFHLQVLRYAGFVKSRRVGKWTVYRLSPGMPNGFLSAVAMRFAIRSGFSSANREEAPACCLCEAGESEES